MCGRSLPRVQKEGLVAEGQRSCWMVVLEVVVEPAKRAPSVHTIGQYHTHELLQYPGSCWWRRCSAWRWWCLTETTQTLSGGNEKKKEVCYTRASLPEGQEERRGVGVLVGPGSAPTPK